ncbi:hypothetical protein [Romboutsia ilealis]|uniref:hypothetical protein n=2 Tax=Romboutsia ilealis TaxID=1115758 RepID=UPI0025B76E6B|nr:hypothetical protein [Romboutsia ilealis]
MSQNDEYFKGSISPKGLIGLYIYYTILTVLGIFLFFFVTIVNNLGYDPFKLFSAFISPNVSGDSTINFYNLAFIGSISSSLLGSSVSYIRKIYKMSLGNHFSNSQASYSENFGSMLYFIYRPIFAIIFSLIIFLAIKIGIIPILNIDSQISSSTVDICMFISFFVGLNAGKLLNVLEKGGNKLVDNIGSHLENGSN